VCHIGYYSDNRSHFHRLIKGAFLVSYIGAELTPKKETAMTVYYIGLSDPNTCACGEPSMEGETGCVECMLHVYPYVQLNDMRGLCSEGRSRELIEKLIDAGVTVDEILESVKAFVDSQKG
jgi:hypothetical protein